MLDRSEYLLGHAFVAGMALIEIINPVSSPEWRSFALGVVAGSVFCMRFVHQKKLRWYGWVSEIIMSGFAGYFAYVLMSGIASTQFWDQHVGIPFNPGVLNVGSITAGMGGSKFCGFISEKLWRQKFSDQDLSDVGL